MNDGQVSLSRAPRRIGPPAWTPLLRLWPGAVMVAVTAWFTALSGVPVAAVGLYLAAFSWSVMLPGVLVHRALRGTPSSLVADLALGGATGLVLQLIAWGAFTALHIASWLVLWPVAVVIPFLASPGLRRCWAVGPLERTVHPLAASLVVLAFLLPLLGLAVGIFGSTDLPPAGTAWYQDDLWHLALSAELMRSVPPDIPQLAGQTFYYHWFSNAHIAAMTWTTGLDLPVVFARLWMPPIVALAVGAVFAVGETLTRRTWPGAVAALLMGAPAAIFPSWFSLSGFTSFALHSPSQVFSLPIIGLALHVLIAALRDRRFGRGSWAVLALALVGSSGAKSSVLPVLVCGVMLALGVAVLVRRDMVRRLVAILALSVVTLLATSLLTSGASAGVTLQLFSTVRSTQPWALMMGTSSPFSTAAVLPGLDRAGALALLGLVLLSWVVGYAWVLPAVRALGRRDLSGWLLLGVGLGGWAAMMLLSQDGLSQVYFMSGAVVALYPLAAWGLALSWDVAASRAGSRNALLSAAVGAGLAVPLLLLSRNLSGPVPSSAHINGSVLRSLVVPGVVAVVAAAAMLLGRRPRYAVTGALLFLAVSTGLLTAAVMPSRVPGSGDKLPDGAHLTIVVAGLLAVLGATVLALRPSLGRRLSRPLLGATATATVGVLVLTLVAFQGRAVDERVRAAPPRTAALVTADEVMAARWLQSASMPDDIIATNVHCRSKRTVPSCDARAYWVTAFTQRRALVEGWAYTKFAHERNGVGGRSFARQPFEDPALLALNEKAFRAPSAAIVASMRSKGVRWLFADTAAGPVAAQLNGLTDLVHESGTVKIFRLR